MVVKDPNRTEIYFFSQHYLTNQLLFCSERIYIKMLLMSLGDPTDNQQCSQPQMKNEVQAKISLLS